jgi:hypothetical protein
MANQTMQYSINSRYALWSRPQTTGGPKAHGKVWVQYPVGCLFSGSAAVPVGLVFPPCPKSKSRVTPIPMPQHFYYDTGYGVRVPTRTSLSILHSTL